MASTWPFAFALLFAAVTVTSAAPPGAPGATPPAPRLERLSWLAGSWVADSAGTRSEEHWMAPRGGLMVGMNRLVSGGQARMFEFVRIRERGDTIVYLASPGGRSPATPFPMVEMGERRVTFENPAHDFPQRVLYWLGADDRLHARVEGKMNGRLEGENYVWKRGSLSR